MIARFNASESPTGQQAYKQIANSMSKVSPEGSPARGIGLRQPDEVAASKALAEAGIPGHKYMPHESKATNYVIYDDSRVSIQNYEQGKRGSVTFAPNQRPILKVFQEANASTGIHELGHIWLEDMLHDAAHPAANDDLRADGKAIRRNLGMADDQNSPLRKQHEQFAKWAEQYLREGRAPSPELAGVFAKFKAWLTNIYQTIKGLGVPINDEMRGVFDRLLSSPSNRTVIVPENPATKSLADIHKAEAANVHPANGKAVGDRIESERASYVEEQHPQIIAELRARDAINNAVGPAAGATDAGAENPERAVEPAALATVGGGPEPQPAGGSGSGQLSEIIPSRPESVAESPVVGSRSAAGGDTGLREQRPVSSGSTGVDAIAPKSPELLTAGTDERAGNLRRVTVGTVPEVWAQIKAAAARNDGFADARRGRVSNQQVIDLANEIGMEGAHDIVAEWVRGRALNSEQVVALGNLIKQSGKDLHDAYMRSQETHDPADVLKHVELAAQHDLIQAALSGAAAEAGRATNAMKLIKRMGGTLSSEEIIRQATGRTLNQNLAEAAFGSTLDTTAKISKWRREISKEPDFWDRAVELWTNSINSGFLSHVTYGIGRTMLSVYKAGPETLAAAAISRLRQSPAGERVYFGEAPAQFNALAANQNVALRAGLAALKTGARTLLPGESPHVMWRGIPAPAASLDPEGHIFSVAQGLADRLRGGSGIAAMGERTKESAMGEPFVTAQPSGNGPIENLTVGGVPVPVGGAVRVPNRVLGALGSYLDVLDFSMERARFGLSRRDGCARRQRQSSAR